MKSSDNVSVLKIEKFDKATSNNPFASWSDADYVNGPSPGSSFANGLPISKPPYAHLTAIDLNAGDLSWRIPFGKGSDIIRRHPALRGWRCLNDWGRPGTRSDCHQGWPGLHWRRRCGAYAFDKSTGMKSGTKIYLAEDGCHSDDVSDSQRPSVRRDCDRQRD